jgi:ABC-type siderophore export system fused ATPase/permease subunit
VEEGLIFAKPFVRPSALYRVRLRVLNKVREGELQSLERIGTTEIYERLTQEANTVRASPRLSV